MQSLEKRLVPGDRLTNRKKGTRIGYEKPESKGAEQRGAMVNGNDST